MVPQPDSKPIRRPRDTLLENGDLGNYSFRSRKDTLGLTSFAEDHFQVFAPVLADCD